MEVAMLLHGSPEHAQAGPSTGPECRSGNTLKRRASVSCEDVEGSNTRKKLKERMTEPDDAPDAEAVDGQALAEELDQELQCGCCSALVYRPVVVAPCQHFFCGSCIVLWVRNGGTNCPACRGISTSVTPSRALQTIADILVRASPSRARSVNERMQADDIYKSGTNLRIPPPRQASPEPSIPQSNPNYVHPCPHCLPGNQYDWRCPQPIVDPEADPDGAWRIDDGSPPGHGYCGNCENILALRAPSTTKCDFCQVSFCGIGIPGRCVAAPIPSQHLHALTDIGDLIECGEIYEIFDGNAFEVDVLLDYLQEQGLSPRHIYREIIGMILRSPRQFAPLIELDLFADMHGVVAGNEPDPNAPRSRICRMCATEVLLWGLREWWIQERKKGLLEASVAQRPDCPQGGMCSRQKDHAHAKEFNHIVGTPEAQAAYEPPAPPVEAPQPQQTDIALPVPVASDEPPLLLLPNEEGVHGGLDVGPNEVLERESEQELEQLKLEDLLPTPTARQSSIFKLLSPATPSYGNSAPPNVSERNVYPSTSQEA